MKTYSEQRKERLSDAVFDYLSDENVTADELLNDFIEVVKDTFDYYDTHAKHCKGVLNALNISNPDITEATVKDWNDFWNSIDNKE